MTGLLPIAVGYAVASCPADLFRQCEAIEEYARAEGLTLAQIVTDDRDALTLHQIAETARHHDARLVLVPAEVTLAGASEGITVVLAEHGATCVVVGRSDTPAAPGAARVAGV